MCVVCGSIRVGGEGVQGWVGVCVGRESMYVHGMWEYTYGWGGSAGVVRRMCECIADVTEDLLSSWTSSSSSAIPPSAPPPYPTHLDLRVINGGRAEQRTC